MKELLNDMIDKQTSELAMKSVIKIQKKAAEKNIRKARNFVK